MEIVVKLLAMSTKETEIWNWLFFFFLLFLEDFDFNLLWLSSLYSRTPTKKEEEEEEEEEGWVKIENAQPMKCDNFFKNISILFSCFDLLINTWA